MTIVVTCQRAVRVHLQIRRDRIKMLTTLWDKLEPVWWKQRTGDAAGGEDAPKKGGKARKGKKKEDDIFHVPESVQ